MTNLASQILGTVAASSSPISLAGYHSNAILQRIGFPTYSPIALVVGSIIARVLIDVVMEEWSKFPEL